MSIRQQQLLKQTSKLSPQQIIEQELLQLNALSLEQYVSNEIEANPVLEKEEGKKESEEEETENEDDDAPEEINDYTLNEDGEYEESYPNKEYTPENGYMNSISNERAVSIYEVLQTQIHQLDMSEEDKRIAEQIIGNIDSNGYFKASCRDVSDYFLLTFSRAVEENKVEEILRRIQSLDPPGIAARTLEENLLLQIKRKLGKKNDNILGIAHEILEKRFALLSSKKYDELMHKLRIDKETLAAVLREIECLHPFPLSMSARSSMPQATIEPDFYIFFRNDKIEASVNQKYIPKLRINQSFLKINAHTFSKREREEADAFIHTNIQKARYFIEAIKMRFDTLSRIIKAIAGIQKKYFQTGDETDLVPMLLKDIAALSRRDVSTVSRAVSGKYADTDWGIKSVKFFFNQSLRNMNAPDGATRRNVEQALADIIKEEDKNAPYTDDQLAKLMEEKGYRVSRRSILAYRRKLKISPSKSRRKL